MSDSRDTQFQGFAKALWEEIMQMTIHGYGRIDAGTDPKNYELLIARRAYDFACRVTKYVGAPEWDDQRIAEMMEYVTDLTELPKEQE